MRKSENSDLCARKLNPGTTLSAINTVLFDMDGLLLDTEPLWGVSMNRVADKHGIGITKERFKETTGLRIHEVTEYLSRTFPWTGSSPAQVAEEILDDII